MIRIALLVLLLGGCSVVLAGSRHRGESTDASVPDDSASVNDASVDSSMSADATDARDASADSSVAVDAYVPEYPPLEAPGGTLDHSCLGAEIPDPPTTSGTVYVRTMGGTPHSGQQVEMWRNHQLGMGCNPPDCELLLTDSRGEATFQNLGSPFVAYRALADEDSNQTLGFRVRPFRSGVRMSIILATHSDYEGIHDTLQRTRGLGGAFGGLVVDCANQPVSNAEIRLFRDTVEIEKGSTEVPNTALYTGLDGSGNATARGLTGVYGDFLGARIPSGLYRVEAWGVVLRDRSRTYERVGCEEVDILDDSLTSIPLAPLRAEHQLDPSCR